MIMNLKNVNSVLIIGIAGGLAKITAGLLIKRYPHLKIVGVDARKTSHLFPSKNIEIHQIPYTRSHFEKLFREYKFDVLIHLGRMGHASAIPKFDLAKRLDLNVMGTNRVLELSLKFKIKKVLILSTFHVYGAYSDNPTYIEEEAPLRADLLHPELRDVVEMDQLATNWMYKNQGDQETVVLRPCNIVGPQIKNTIGHYLKSPYSFIPIDFNPMFQFIHEFDMANVIIMSLEKIKSGVFNVAPDEVISLKEAKKHTKNPGIKAPLFLVGPALSLLGNPLGLPTYLVDYLKFSCILDNSKIKKTLGEFSFLRYKSKDALEMLSFD